MAGMALALAAMSLGLVSSQRVSAALVRLEVLARTDFSAVCALTVVHAASRSYSPAALAAVVETLQQSRALVAMAPTDAAAAAVAAALWLAQQVAQVVTAEMGSL